MIKKKLIIDDRIELHELEFRHRVMLKNNYTKKMDIAPSTRYLMTIAESGLMQRLERTSGPKLEYIFRYPCIPFKSKRLQKVSVCIPNLFYILCIVLSNIIVIL